MFGGSLHNRHKWICVKIGIRRPKMVVVLLVSAKTNLNKGTLNKTHTQILFRGVQDGVIWEVHPVFGPTHISPETSPLPRISFGHPHTALNTGVPFFE